jgi:hypothetical protein
VECGTVTNIYKTFLAVIYNFQTLYWVTTTLSCHPDLLAKTAMVESGNPYWRGRISTVDLLVPSSSDQLLFILKLLNEEVNCTETSPSVRVPWLNEGKMICLSGQLEAVSS